MLELVKGSEGYSTVETRRPAKKNVVSCINTSMEKLGFSERYPPFNMSQKGTLLPLLLLSAITILPRISCLYLIITAYLYLVIFGHFEWGPQHSLLFSSHKMVQCICTEYSSLHLCGGEKKSKKVSFCT